MIKGSIIQEDKIIVNVYAFKNSFKICYAKTDKTIKRQSHISVRNCNSLLSKLKEHINRSSSLQLQRILHTVNQLDLSALQTTQPYENGMCINIGSQPSQSTKKTPGPDHFTDNFNQILKEEIFSLNINSFKKLKRKYIPQFIL